MANRFDSALGRVVFMDGVEINFSPHRSGLQFRNPKAYARLDLFPYESPVPMNLYPRWLLLERNEDAKVTTIHKLVLEGNQTFARSLAFEETRLFDRHHPVRNIVASEIPIARHQIITAQRNGVRVEIGLPFALGQFSTNGPVNRLELGSNVTAFEWQRHGELLQRFEWVALDLHDALEKSAARQKALGEREISAVGTTSKVETQLALDGLSIVTGN